LTWAHIRNALPLSNQEQRRDDLQGANEESWTVQLQQAITADAYTL
jgi:hypothetical protein